MALQEKIIVCGAGPTFLGMALRFVAGPAATAAGALAMGLRGDVLRLAIIQVGSVRSVRQQCPCRSLGYCRMDDLSTLICSCFVW